MKKNIYLYVFIPSILLLTILSCTENRNQLTIKQLNDSANYYYYLLDFDKAKIFGLQALNKLSDSADFNDSVAAYKNLALIYMDLDQTDSSFYFSSIDSSLLVRNEKGNSVKMVENLNIQAICCYTHGMYPEGLRYLDSALILSKKINENKNYCLAKTIYNIARLYKYEWDYSKAYKLNEEALNNMEEIKDSFPSLYSDILNLKYMIKDFYGQYNEALSLITEALKYEKMEYGSDHPMYLLLLINYASALTSSGEYVKAEKILLKVTLELSRILGKKHGLYMSAIYALSQLYRNLQLPEKSLDIIKDTYKTVSENPKEYRDIYNYLYSAYASALFENGKLNEAEKIYIHLINKTKRENGLFSIYYAAYLNTLGNLYVNTGNYGTGLKLYRESLLIDMAVTANMDGFNRHFSFFKGLFPFFNYNIKNFMKMFYAVITGDFYKTNSYSICIGNIAWYYFNIGEYDKAIGLYKQCLEYDASRLGKTHYNNSIDLSNITNAYLLKNDYDNTKKSFGKLNKVNLDIINHVFPMLCEKDKFTFYKSISSDNQRYFQFTFDNIDKDKSLAGDLFNYRINTKAIILDEMKKINSIILNSKDSSLIKTYDNWKMNKELLSKIELHADAGYLKQMVNVDSIVKLTDEQEKMLNSDVYEINKMNKSRNITWKDIQKSLGKDEAVVEIIDYKTFGLTKNKYNPSILIPDFTDSSVYAALILTRNSKYPIPVMLGNGNQLEKKYYKQYSGLIESVLDFSEKKEPLKTLGALYDVYWKEIENKLGNVKKIYLSPDGVYNKINLNILYDTTGRSFLVEKYGLSLITNPKDMVLLKKKETLSKHPFAALFGDPEYHSGTSDNKVKKNAKTFRSDISPIPGTRLEIDSIAGILVKNGWHAKEYLGKEASEDNIKELINPTALHIATHGYFDVPENKKAGDKEPAVIYQSPLIHSYLLLAGAGVIPEEDELLTGKYNDGFLTSYEASGMILDSTLLVVLSACNSGRGSIKNGEGVYGLQRAFAIAGAKALIMTLWEINDSFTRKFMTDFYRRWMAGSTIKKAFRNTQLYMIADGQKFSDWGAFVLSGF